MQFAVRRGGVQYGESKFVYYGVNNEMTEEKEGAMKAVQELLEVSDPEDEQETTRNTTPSQFTFPTNSTPITHIFPHPQLQQILPKQKLLPSAPQEGTCRLGKNELHELRGVQLFK